MIKTIAMMMMIKTIVMVMYLARSSGLLLDTLGSLWLMTEVQALSRAPTNACKKGVRKEGGFSIGFQSCRNVLSESDDIEVRNSKGHCLSANLRKEEKTNYQS